MFCKTCGKQLNNDEMVCTSCGTPREASAPVEQAPAAPEAAPTIQPIPATEPVQAVPEVAPITEPVQAVPEVAPIIEPVPAAPEVAPVVEQAPVANPVGVAPAPATPEASTIIPTPEPVPVTEPAPPAAPAAEAPKKKPSMVFIIIIVVGILAIAGAGVFLLMNKEGEEPGPSPSPSPSPTTPIDVTNQNKFSYEGMDFTYPDGYQVSQTNGTVEIKSSTKYYNLKLDYYNSYEDYTSSVAELKEIIKESAGETGVVLDPTVETVDGRQYTIFQVQNGSQVLAFYLTRGTTYSTFIGLIVNSNYVYNKEDLNDLTSILNSVGDTSSFAAPPEEEKAANPIKIDPITIPTFEESTNG